MNIPELWQQFGAEHPIYSHLLSFGVGMAGGWKLIGLAEEKGIPWLVDWADAYQERALTRVGLTQEQILSVKEHEVADLRKSADELEKNIKEARAPKP